MATLREMESVALSMGGPDIGLSGDLGNVIDITDTNDALGLNMLANPGKISFGNQSSGQTVTVSAPQQPQQNFSGIEVSSLEPLEPITLDAGFGSSQPVEISLNRETAPPPNLFSNQQSATGPSVSLAPAQQQRDPEKEKKDKIEYLNKLQRLEQKGFPVQRRFTMDNSLEEIKQEYDRLVDARNLEASLRFQRQALMGVVTGLEWMNNRFDPLDIHLDGWSESVHENVEDFDEIFEELYDKYKDRGKMAPEARLMMALAGSGFMCHVSNTFMRQRMPSADDILKNNPELARQFAAAAANQAGPGFGNLMGMAMGVPQQMPAGPQGMPPQQQPARNTGPTGAFFGSSQQEMRQEPQVMASVEPPRTARREMRGPTGVDDILRTFEEVRRTEVMGPMGNGMEQMGSMSSSGQPATAAVMEMESIHSGDLGSMADSTRTGGGRRRGRKAAVVGNTLSVNV